MDPDPAITVEPLTLEEFERLPGEEDYRLELVRGRLVREPGPSFRHGRIVVRLCRALDERAEANGWGAVVADVWFLLEKDPPTVRLPDVAFLAEVPPEEDADSLSLLAPDLAVEVLSPSNRASEIQGKVLDYLSAGTRLVWVVDPHTRSVTAYRSGRDACVLTVGDVLDGEEVLPGLELAVGALFRGLGSSAER